MSTATTVKALVRHRKLSWLQLATIVGVQAAELNTLRPQVTELEAAAARATTLHEGARLLAAGLRLQLDEALDIRDDINAKAVRCDEAEARATAAELALAEQTSELVALRAFRDNQLAMSDLAAQRLQAPASPPSTARRFTVGRVLHAAASPHAAHIPTPVVDNEATVEIPLPAPVDQPDAMELAGVWPKHQAGVA